MRSVADSLMTQATEGGTLSVLTEGKKSGPVPYVANQYGKGKAIPVLKYCHLCINKAPIFTCETYVLTSAQDNLERACEDPQWREAPPL